MAHHHEEHEFHRKEAIGPSVKALGILGAGGLLVASVQATLTKQNIGLFGTFTRYGPTVATFAAMGGAYEFFRIASANLREKNDSYNEAVGGFFTGAIVGLRYRTIPRVIGLGAGLSITMAAFHYTGSSLFGGRANVEVDAYERKEALRANKRRPIQETLAELGEGRGIYGPGHEERRRERIRERYGIEVPSV